MKSILTLFFAAFSFSVAAQELSYAYSADCKCYGFKDKKGNLVIEYQYTSAADFSEGLASVRLNNKSGFIDKDNKVVIPLIYDQAYTFSEGLAAVRLNGQWGYLDKNGNPVIPLTLSYNKVEKFHEGMAPVKLNEKWGYIDRKGNLAIATNYHWVDKFSEGLAAVKPIADQGYGFINKKGELVIPVQFNYAFPFDNNGTALVTTATKKSVRIDRTGKVLNDEEYTAIANKNIEQTIVSDNYAKGYAAYEAKNYEEASRLWKISAVENQSSAAYFGLGILHHNSKVAGSNYTTAMEYYQKAADLGMTAALVEKQKLQTYLAAVSAAREKAASTNKPPANATSLQLCEWAAEKLKSADSRNVALTMLRKIDAQGDTPAAAYYLATGFKNGHIHAPNIEVDSALFYYQKAAKKGYRGAMYSLGMLYQYANGKEFPTPSASNKYHYLADDKKALYWFNEYKKNGGEAFMLAIKIESLEKAIAKREVANAYAKGYDAFESENYEEAYRLWKMSALEQQNASAYFGLAILHQMGKAPGYSFNTAIEYYQKAADLGIKDALIEKQKIQNYLDALVAARNKAAASTSSSSSSLAKQSNDYDEWWQKTYGKGGTQNRTPMTNLNIPQASYKTGTQSEADRHQKAMDRIYNSTYKQMERGFRNGN